MKIAESLGKDDFTLSDGWLSRWKERNHIKFCKSYGEKNSADLTSDNEWIQNILPSLFQEYHADDIYNADETALIYRAAPSFSMKFRGEKCFGMKTQKERITVLLCCNMTGSEKKKPFVIGKSKMPRCFKGVKNLPVAYAANENAWMTTALFNEFLKKWDNEINHRKEDFTDNR